MLFKLRMWLIDRLAGNDMSVAIGIETYGINFRFPGVIRNNTTLLRDEPPHGFEVHFSNCKGLAA